MSSLKPIPTAEKVLADKNLIHGVEHVDDEVRFRIGTLKTVVSVKLFFKPNSLAIHWVLSHGMKTPLDRAPYYGDGTDKGKTTDASTALLNAAGTLTVGYRPAAEKHAPSEDWLVPNPKFDHI